MPRSPRRPVMISLAIVLLIAVVAAVAYLAGRTRREAEPTPSTSPTTASAPSSAPASGYSPTTDAGSPEPALARGAVAAGRGGTGVGPAGLPVGYSDDRNGAAAAATNYLIWMNSIRITNKKAADAMATATAADPTTRASLIKSFDDVRSGMQGLRDDQPEPARGAYAIAAYASGRATIYIWSPEVTTDTNGVMDQSWGIDAVRLNWIGNDWKLDQALIAKTGGAAVDPVDPAGDPTTAEKHAILSRTPADPGDITDTADQTWFEYANAPG